MLSLCLASHQVVLQRSSAAYNAFLRGHLMVTPLNVREPPSLSLTNVTRIASQGSAFVSMKPTIPRCLSSERVQKDLFPDQQILTMNRVAAPPVELCQKPSSSLTMTWPGKSKDSISRSAHRPMTVLAETLVIDKAFFCAFSSVTTQVSHLSSCMPVGRTHHLPECPTQRK